MTETNICPCCGRHCSMDDLHCERGEEYRRTGQLPAKGREGTAHHEHHERHRGHGDINDKLIDLLRDLSHMMRAQYEGKSSQKRILMILKEAGPITQRDLTEQLGIQPGSASELLAKLEAAGLIARTQNEEDRRTIDVQLTESGKALAVEAKEQRQNRHRQMFSCLSEEEKHTLIALLKKVCIDWRKSMSEEKHPHGHGDHHHESHGGRGTPNFHRRH